MANAFEPFGNFLYGFVGILGWNDADVLRLAAPAAQRPGSRYPRLLQACPRRLRQGNGSGPCPAPTVKFDYTGVNYFTFEAGARYIGWSGRRLVQSSCPIKAVIDLQYPSG